MADTVSSFYANLNKPSTGSSSTPQNSAVTNFYNNLPKAQAAVTPAAQPTSVPSGIRTVQAPQGGFKIGDVISNITKAASQAVKTVESTFTNLSNGIKVALTKPTIVSPIPEQKTVPTIQDFQTGQKKLSSTQMSQLQPSFTTPTAGTSAQLTPAIQKKIQTASTNIVQFINDQTNNIQNMQRTTESKLGLTAIGQGERETYASFIDNFNPQLAQKFRNFTTPVKSTLVNNIYKFIGQQLPYIPLAILTEGLLNPETAPIASKVPLGTSIITNLLSNMAKGAINAGPVVGVLSGIPATKTLLQRAENVGIGTIAGSIFGAVGAGTRTIASELINKFGVESKPFLANWDLVTKVLNASDNTKYTPEENAQVVLLNKLGLTGEVAHGGRAGAGISVTTESPAQGPIWDFLRSIFTGHYVPKANSEVSNAPGNLLTAGEHTPEEVINTVIKSDLKNTPDGKILMKTAMEAQKTGQNIMIGEPPKPQAPTGVGGVPQATSEVTKPSTTVIKPQEVSVPREQLPIGTGKEQVSRLAARVSESLTNAPQEVKDQLGTTTFNQMNNDKTIKLASEYVTKNPEEALKVLEGQIAPPKGLNTNSIYVAMAQQPNLNSDLAIRLASLKSTAMGQNIEILKMLDPNSPVKVTSSIIKAREQRMQTKYATKTAKEVSNRMVEKGERIIKPPTKLDWAAIIKEVRCP